MCKVVVACVSTPAHASMCVPSGGGGSWPPGKLGLLRLQSWTKFLYNFGDTYMYIVPNV